MSMAEPECNKYSRHLLLLLIQDAEPHLKSVMEKLPEWHMTRNLLSASSRSSRRSMSYRLQRMSETGFSPVRQQQQVHVEAHGH